MRGFKTARSLAHALGIDENRYTRYERAEVEPDLELIQQICETLRLSPNDLFGTQTPLRDKLALPAQPVPGFAEPGQAAVGTDVSNGHGHQGREAWILAYAVAELESLTDTGADAPLATLQRAARLFADIESRPYAAVSEILLLPALATAPREDALRISRLIEAVTKTAA